MAQQQGGPAPSQGRNLQVNVREVSEGAKLMTTDGATVEVVSNPHDGIWLLVRYITSPSDPSLEGSEDMLWVDSVAGLAQ